MKFSRNRMDIFKEVQPFIIGTHPIQILCNFSDTMHNTLLLYCFKACTPIRDAGRPYRISFSMQECSA